MEFSSMGRGDALPGRSPRIIKEFSRPERTPPGLGGPSPGKLI